ncbi:hypothetical protein KAI65_03865 [Candidatus Parcubacteria bacterium]|nr:hypothetical protein [Candidatus Parcubacteria bacterium]
MPEVRFESYSIGNSGNINIEPQDIEFLETEDYKVVGVKWHEDSWSSGSGIQWEEWISVFYQKKGQKEIKEEETERIVIRDATSSRYDRKELWPYKYLILTDKDVSEMRFAVVKVAWADEHGYEREEKKNIP